MHGYVDCPLDSNSTNSILFTGQLADVISMLCLVTTGDKTTTKDAGVTQFTTSQDK